MYTDEQEKQQYQTIEVASKEILRLFITVDYSGTDSDCNESILLLLKNLEQFKPDIRNIWQFRLTDLMSLPILIRHRRIFFSAALPE